MQIGPDLANGAADHPPSDLTEPGTIKIPQIDDVGGHRDILAPVARSAGCANLPCLRYVRPWQSRARRRIRQAFDGLSASLDLDIGG